MHTKSTLIVNAQNTILHIIYRSKPMKPSFFEAMKLRISRVHHFNLSYVWCIHADQV